MNSPKYVWLAALIMCCAIVVFGCDKASTDANGADSTGTDVTSAQGSMESDAENFGETEEQQPDSGEKKKEEKAVSVNASAAFTGDLVIPVVAEGTILARNSAEVIAEISGKLISISAVEGQRVGRGQLIAKLDDRELEVAVEEARAKYLQALSLLTIEETDVDVDQLSQAVRDEFADLEKQERAGKISREQRVAREVQMDVDAIKEGKFRYEVAAARSGVSAARAALERARVNLERTEIRAPFAGVIVNLKLSTGQQVKTNELICNLVDNVNIEAEVGVLEGDLGQVEVGKPVLLSLPALDRMLEVSVDVVSPQFDRETRTCKVLLRLQNPDGRVFPGMFVRAQIAGVTHKDRLLVPREAIIVREGRPLLFKVEDGRAKWLYVELGESNEHLVEIKKVVRGGNLEPGDKVVVSDHLTLAHDAKLKIKKTVPSEDPWVAFSKAGE